MVIVDVDEINNISSDLIAKKAHQKFIDSGMKADFFEPKDANPTYTEETQYKKIHE